MRYTDEDKCSKVSGEQSIQQKYFEANSYIS